MLFNIFWQVLNNIHVLAKHLKRSGVNVPSIEDDLSSRSLFAASLLTGAGPLFPEDAATPEARPSSCPATATCTLPSL